MARLIILLSVIYFSVYLTEQTYFLKHDYIAKINEVATTWKAGKNFDPNTPKEAILKLLGSKGIDDKTKQNGPIKTSDPNYPPDNYIFKNFDARKRWRHCSTMGEVRDQGNCGSCWAFGATGAFSDRLCIATEGKFNQLLSAEKLTFCCYSCGYGCSGGYPIRAWQYFNTYGIVSGGNYNTTDGCQPYQVKPCLHGQEGEGSCASKPREEDHKCVPYSCYGDQSIVYDEDIWRTRDYYRLYNSTIQKDVQTYGPVEASFQVYDDFLSYKSGVYVKTDNATYLGGHAVKLIGWGKEQGVNYWLLVNSWGTSWGDKGLFKIRRGTNECFIDSSCTAGVPADGPSN